MCAVKNTDNEIIVFDNRSTDGSKAFLQNRFPEVRFIWNKENLGFAKANNHAVDVSRGDYILFLNPDTLLPEDCIEKCLEFIQSQNDQCALGVRMVDGSGKFLKESKRSFPGPMTSLYKLSGLAKFFPKSKIFARYHLGHLPENKTCEVDVLAGAFIIVPRKIFSEISGFDESFFMYGEDIDLSYRIQKAGYKNYYFAGTTILHFKGESAKKGSLNYVRMFYKAMSVFAKKHYGGSRAGVYNFFIQSGILLRGMASALSRFLKWVGLPFLDALLILLSFWLGKIFWQQVKPSIGFDNTLLLIAFPLFSLLFLITAYYSGLYDNGYKQSRLNKSASIAALVSFTVYTLLPVSIQFSRGVMLFSLILAFLLLTLLRMLFVSMGIIQKSSSDADFRMAVVGSKEEYGEVMKVLSFPGRDSGILGRIFVKAKDNESIGSMADLPQLIRRGNINGLVYCKGTLSFRQIIDSIERLDGKVYSAIYTAGCHAVIASHDKETSGGYYTKNEYLKLANPLYRRAKRLLDAGFALFFILTFPVHLFLKEKFFLFMKNCFEVLFFKKTFVSYALNTETLPPLKPGLITTSGQPFGKPGTADQISLQSDYFYAKYYSAWTDVKLIKHNYKQLS